MPQKCRRYPPRPMTLLTLWGELSQGGLKSFEEFEMV